MAKVLQEFYCNKCNGFFTVKLSVGHDRDIKLKCPGPGCTREHPRAIKDGKIYERANRNENATEIIIVPKSAYSKKPVTAKMRKLLAEGATYSERGGAELTLEEMAARDAQLASDAMRREIWIERFARKS